MTGTLKARVAGQWKPVFNDASNAIDHWNTAWGVVAMGDVTDGLVTLVTAPGAVITTAISFQPQVGRRYAIKYQIRAIQSTGVASGQVSLYIDGTLLPLSDSYFEGEMNYGGRTFQWTIVGDGVLHTYQLRANGTNIVFHNQRSGLNCYFYIEDIGPVNRAISSVANPTPSWTPFAFGSGWANYGAGYEPCGYRKIGDMVYVRGLAVGTVAENTAITTLQVDYRPRIQVVTLAITNMGGQRIDVYPDGVIAGVNNPANTRLFISLNQLSFSVL